MGRGTSICMHIGPVPRERPPFSALNFRPGAYNFHKLPKNPFRSITILHFFGGFCRSGDYHFKNLVNFNTFIASHGRLRQRRGLAALPEIRIVTLKMDQTRSGYSHFHAQNGSSSLRSPTFSRSTGSSFV